MLPALVVLVAVIGVYLQSLGGPFLWDDRLLVIDAPLVEKTAPLGEYLSQPFWMGGGAQPRDPTYYRPLVTLSLAVDHRLHGSNSGGYHLTNVVLHAACALLLLALLRRAGARASVATLLAVGWALLPRLAEAAAWISGRTDLLASGFAFAALLAWGPSLGRRLLAAALLGFGLLSKESALAVLPAVAVSQWVATASPARLRRVVERVWPLGVSVMLYLALRLSVVGYSDEALPLGAGRRVLTVLHTIGTYFAMLLDAWRPRAVIGRVGVTSPALMALGALVLVALGVLAARARSRLVPASALGFALAAFSIFPVLHVVPLPIRTLAADRFLYLPTAGLALALAPVVDGWLGAARVRWAGAVALVLSLAVGAFHRVGVWSDELEFWVTTYLETPHINSAPATELFGVYYRAGLYADAFIIADRALHYADPSRKDALYNSALCLSRLGRRDEAAQRFSASRSKAKSNDETDLLLAILDVQTGHGDEARPELERLVRRGTRGASWILERLPELIQARSALDALGTTGDPERRARLATLLADDARATTAWVELSRRPGVTKGTLEEALAYLVQTGHRTALETVARAHLARFGAIDPKLAAMIDVHLGELERLEAARSRIGL